MKIKIVSFLFVTVILLSSCIKETKEKNDYNTKILVAIVNNFNKTYDYNLNKIQNDLKLDFKQTEILYLLKSGLLNKIPDVRQMIFDFQLELIKLIEKDSINESDSIVLINKLNIVEKNFKDIINKQFIEFHSTLDNNQKKKLIAYIDGKRFLMSYFTPISGYLYFKDGINLYNNLRLTKDQKRTFLKFYKEIKNEFKLKHRILLKEGLLQKETIKNLINSDKIDSSQMNEIYYSYIKLFDEFKNITAKNIVVIHKSLSKEQKEVLIKFFTDFSL